MTITTLMDGFSRDDFGCYYTSYHFFSKSLCYIMLKKETKIHASILTTKFLNGILGTILSDKRNIEV